jgi:hypothetical protein
VKNENPVFPLKTDWLTVVEEIPGSLTGITIKYQIKTGYVCKWLNVADVLVFLRVY